LPLPRSALSLLTGIDIEEVASSSMWRSDIRSVLHEGAAYDSCPDNVCDTLCHISRHSWSRFHLGQSLRKLWRIA
jgi:hypothetical protein